MERTRTLRVNRFGCHTLRDLNQRVVDLVFCRADKCTPLQLCTSMVYCLSYHIPEEDRLAFYQQVGQVYPKIQRVLNSMESEEPFAAPAALLPHQRRIPNSSIEADEFADYVVQVASQRFSRAVEAARHRELLSNIAHRKLRASSTSARSKEPFAAPATLLPHQRRITNSSIEADEFAAYVVQVASQRFSRAIEAVRHREL